MSKYIILSVTDIENRIKNLIEDDKMSSMFESLSIGREIRVWKEILNESKQISLDENDIEKKAEMFAKTTSYYSMAKFAYEKALKDLL